MSHARQVRQVSKRAAIRLIAGALLLLSAMALFLGPRYEISKLTQAERSQMTDFDWMGEEWAVRAVFLFAGAVLFAGIGWYARRRIAMSRRIRS